LGPTIFPLIRSFFQALAASNLHGGDEGPAEIEGLKNFVDEIKTKQVFSSAAFSGCFF
jgi:hypothetical protein